MNDAAALTNWYTELEAATAAAGISTSDVPLKAWELARTDGDTPAQAAAWFARALTRLQVATVPA